MNQEAVSNLEAIAQIRRDYHSGVIDRDEAKRRAEPVIKRINDAGALIAKKHKRRHNPVNFTQLMRG